MSGFAIKRNGRPMNASTIRLSRVSKRYGRRRVLHDVSFEVDQSELCALVGANGAGKSTLIKIVLGLCEPSSGSVELFGGKSKKRAWSDADACRLCARFLRSIPIPQCG